MSKQEVAVAKPQNSAIRMAESRLTPEGLAQLNELRQLSLRSHEVRTTVAYDAGAVFARVLKAEARYGPDAFKNICLLTETKPQQAAQFSKFSTSFPRSEVIKVQKQAATEKFAFTLGHWLHLSTLTEPKDRTRVLGLVMKEKLTTTDLEVRMSKDGLGKRAHRHGGGRNPKLNLEPVAFLQQARNGFVKQERFLAAAVKSQVFDRVADVEAKKLTAEFLARAEDVQQRAANILKVLQVFHEKLGAATLVLKGRLKGGSGAKVQMAANEDGEFEAGEAELDRDEVDADAEVPAAAPPAKAKAPAAKPAKPAPKAAPADDDEEDDADEEDGELEAAKSPPAKSKPKTAVEVDDEDDEDEDDEDEEVEEVVVPNRKRRV